VLEKLKSWMSSQRVLVTTMLGSAIRYTLSNWKRLTVFVNHPLVWLDNNATERGLRGPVIGRRNHFGSKSVRGTEVAATMYTLVESAKVSGVDPIAYLIAVATRTRRDGSVLLPAEFKSTLEVEVMMGSARNRRRREERRRKRQDQRQYRRITVAMNVAPKMVRRAPAGLPKMSDVLATFAEPLLDGIPPDSSVAAYEAELVLASAIWNFLVALDDAHDRGTRPVQISEEEVGEILDLLTVGSDMTDDEALDLLQELTARKHDLFPDERRIVGDVRVYFRGDRLHVTTISSPPR
jgi:hypothetical protein